MPRRAGVKPRKIEADPVYANVYVTRLINRSMYEGKKSVAAREIYEAFERVRKVTESDPVAVFMSALDGVRPVMEVRPRRIGGAAYQVPVQVRGRRQDSLAIRWLVEGARSRPNGEYHTFGEKMAAEILDASKGEGYAIKKKQEVERVAEANKAFAHFKW
jgi:small subunit ribosomal protein S7